MVKGVCYGYVDKQEWSNVSAYQLSASTLKKFLIKRIPKTVKRN